MCGFAGFLNLGRARQDPSRRRAILEAMGQAMERRGPDDERFYDDGFLSLVFRRLAIVDVAGGQQPLFNEDGQTLLVCNGEIYNHDDLRGRLSVRHDFKSHTDCESVLHAYEEWGLEAFQQVFGMFALAVWDRRHQRLTLARDRLGIKPLYVCKLPDGLLFGSELKALLMHPACPRDVDWKCLDQDLLGGEPASTYISGVEFLHGGEYLVAEPGKAPVRGRYWQLEDHFGAAPFGLVAERYAEEYQALLETVTAEHLQGEASIGIHLSGGIDSSLLAAVISRQRRDVPCFTVVERASYLAGDVAAARQVTEQLGLPWMPVLFDYRTLLDRLHFDLGYLEQSVWMMGTPRFDLEWLMKEALTHTVRQSYPDIKVLMLGQGADEFAGGYSNRLDRPHKDWADYLADEIMPMSKKTPRIEGKVSTRDIGPYHEAMRRFAWQLQKHNLWHEDRTSAWHGMEARVPFLDHRLVELLASVPDSLHETLFWDKRIIRQCTRGLFPAYDSERRKVAFCLTEDARSTLLVVHGMVERLAADFVEKYVQAEGFPFDRQVATARIRSVLAREPGFYAESFRVMEMMTSAIFQKQSRIAGKGTEREIGGRGVSLDIVAENQWGEIDVAFTAQPVITFDWQLDHCPQLPSGATLDYVRMDAGRDRFSLLVDGRVCSEFELMPDHPWLPDFLNDLSNGLGQTMTVQDWLDYFEVTEYEFAEQLNVLLQCGLLATPVREGEDFH